MPAPTFNVLWFCTDQQRFDTVGALDNPHVMTPTLDSLVHGGTAFTHAYCQAPICTPSRASFLSGRYPSTIRVNRNGNPAFPADVPLVTRMFADAGYVCGNVGKLHLASAFRRREPRADDGYTWFDYSHAPRGGDEGGYDYADWVASKGASLNDLVARPEGVPPELHQSIWCAERATAFIEQHATRPWLLTVNPFDPHPPFDPPAEVRSLFPPESMPGPHFRSSDLATQAKLAAVDFQTTARRPEGVQGPTSAMAPEWKAHGAAVPIDADIREIQAAYYAMIKLVDDGLGRILDALDATGQRQRTLVVFTSDHGEMLGDHGLLLKGARFYEGLVRVPLIFNLPGVVSKGLASDALIELIDIAPTLLELAGLGVPADMQGKSLLPILTGRSDGAGHRDFVRCEYLDALDMPDGTLATMYRDRRYKLVVYHGHAFGELYDLASDPWEFDNLWDDPGSSAIRATLTKAAFDAAIAALDKGAPRIARY